MVFVAARMMMRIILVGVRGNLVTVTWRMRGHFGPAHLAAADFRGMRHPGPDGEDQHQARQKGHELAHAVLYHLDGDA
ncbi:hypothetical protein [Sphingomonas phyllosphaerae]|uniref:hypothetical protein n=1 Tax=Sphingomonas phyllosphaerae TaxID=257003 RepID=UPI0012DD8FF4|nr:hypothetical protein [Sphingomonas phyllosphaerae]